MTIVVPRLAREAAAELIERHVASGPRVIARAMPDLSPVVTFSPVGGTRVEPGDLASLRGSLVELAQEHGIPESQVRISEFEGKCARVIHQSLPMTPHEASHEEVWSYLTCCWLLDIAVWRFGAEADERRYIGNVNRNTFRRMWWRAEILGPEVDLTRLGEDELVNIMERPTIAADRRLARAVAAEFLRRVDDGEVPERMQLMREAMKRLLRLTPFVAFTALDAVGVEEIITETFDAAVAGLNGQSLRPRDFDQGEAPQPSPAVVRVETVTLAAPDKGGREAVARHAQEFDTIAQVALDIAQRTGRVTNMTLREVVPITSDEAREVFAALMDRGALVRRGVKRGTYYVLADASDPEGTSSMVALPETPSAARQDDSALRRLLRRPR
jgi:uncharacterized protein DUF6339